ncbi:hypothetical protein DFJ73DRAFT_850611, partial [Zopfochytrium polystomum]
MAPRQIVFKSRVPNFVVPDVDITTLIFESTGRAHSHKTFVIDPLTDTSRTYAQAYNDICRFAAGLYYNAGFARGDVVGIYSPNHIDYPIATHGIIKAGGTVSPANPTYTASELAFQLKDSGAKYLITALSVLEAAQQAAAEAGLPDDRIFLFGDESAGPYVPFRSLFSVEAPPPIVYTKEELANNAAFLCYSSGTTGRSKGVVSTHRNMVSNVLQYYKYMEYFKAQIYEDTWIAVLPMYHIYGLMLLMHIAPHQGYRLVVFPKFEFEPFLNALAKYEVGTAHIVPPIALSIAKSPIVDKYKFPKLRLLFSGAAPLSSDVTQEIKKRLGVPIIQGYGMTETSPLATMSTNTKYADGASGMLVPCVEARLVNPDTGADVGVGKEGEIWLRGPNIMKGYLNNAKATAETIDADGWLHTGDIGVIDRNGFVYIVDRIKELIKYKGLQVAPAELEAYLLTHPAVADSAVIPIPDERAGELPRAYVVLKANVTVTEAELHKFIDAKVSQHKRLRGGIIFTDAIPKSASGKILRRVLRVQDAELRRKQQEEGGAG